MLTRPIGWSWKRCVSALAMAGVLAGCSAQTGVAAPPSTPTADAQPRAGQVQLDPAQVARLKRILPPLFAAMDHPVPLNKVKLGVMDDPHVNAANAGNGEFYVTTGLLQKANDEQLAAVLAHEVAHEDLGHVAKAQRLGLGLNIGAAILDQIIPGSGTITPIAGQLIARSYSRKEEYQADRHGAELLERIGMPKRAMVDTLTWLMQTEGAGSGGFFSTHPATNDRIEALEKSS
jgi:Zn-dependent protease with chaperone function